MTGTRSFGFALLFAVLMGSAVVAQASAADKWAELSLLGDSLLVVREHGMTGTNLDPNVRERVAIDDDSVDRLVLRALASALAGATAPELLALQIRDARLYALQSRLLTTDEGAPFAQSLVKAAAGAGATHMLVIARDPGEFRVELSDSSVGIGIVDGLGFYVNRRTRLTDLKTRNTDVGFLAPFGRVRFMLVDLAAQRIVADAPVKAVSLLSVAGSEASDPWDLLDSTGKVRELEKMLARDAAPTLRQMFARKPR